MRNREVSLVSNNSGFVLQETGKRSLQSLSVSRLENCKPENIFNIKYG